MSKVLLVTIDLANRTGTEVVCSETACGLRKRNHDVAIYTHQAGLMAENMRADGFQVVTDLDSLDFVPDVVQSNQTLPLLDAVGKFPDVPVISICHDPTIWWDEPIELPSIRRYCAVDLACRARIANRLPHLADRIELLLNAVDLDRYQPRSHLPDRPKRALVLAKTLTYLPPIRAACKQHGIALDVVGPGIGREVDDLPSRLVEYDLVFATARGAWEAMAVGCAVILVDVRGLGGLVTQDVVSAWSQKNFGLLLLTQRPSAASVAAEIDRYDRSDAQMVSNFVRQHSSLDQYLDHLEEMYRAVVEESASLTIDRDVLLYRMSQAYRTFARHQQIAHMRRWEGLKQMPVIKLGIAVRNVVRKIRY